MFMFVDATVLTLSPTEMISRSSSSSTTENSVSSGMKIPRKASSFIIRLFYSGFSRSWIFSLYISMIDIFIVNSESEFCESI